MAKIDLNASISAAQESTKPIPPQPVEQLMAEKRRRAKEQKLESRVVKKGGG